MSRDRWGLSFPDICLTVEGKFRQKTQPGKLTRPGIKHVPAWWEATMLPLDHSGGQVHYGYINRSMNRIQEERPKWSLMPLGIRWQVKMAEDSLSWTTEIRNAPENKRHGHAAHTFSRLLSDILIWERCNSISIRFQITDNNTFLAVSAADLIT